MAMSAPITATPVPRVKKALSLEGELRASTGYCEAGAHSQRYRCLSFPVLTLLASIQRDSPSGTRRSHLRDALPGAAPVLYLITSRLYVSLTASSHQTVRSTRAGVLSVLFRAQVCARHVGET